MKNLWIIFCLQHASMKKLALPKRAMAMTMFGWLAGTREIERRERPQRSMELGGLELVVMSDL